VQVVADAIEQPFAAAEEGRHEVELHFVHAAGRQILPGDVRSAGQRHIFTASGSSRLFERRLDAAGDEGERPRVCHARSSVRLHAPLVDHRRAEKTQAEQREDARADELRRHRV
jgi:hypothetical protein